MYNSHGKSALGKKGITCSRAVKSLLTIKILIPTIKSPPYHTSARTYVPASTAPMSIHVSMLLNVNYFIIVEDYQMK